MQIGGSEHSSRARGAVCRLLLVVTLLAVCGERAVAQDPSVVRGQAIAQERCARCHAIGPTGTSLNPKAPPFRDIGKNYPLDHLGEALAEGIVTGAGNMPEFKFGPRDVDAILDYIAEMSARRQP